MGLYKITNILHSGRLDTRGKQRTDDIYPKRIGRVVRMNGTDLGSYIGKSFPLFYVLDENGNDYSNKILMTSNVRLFSFLDDKRIEIETLNSIYCLEKID